MKIAHFSLPLPPTSWNKENTAVIHRGISELAPGHIEPVGRFYLAYARRQVHCRTFSEDERIQAAKIQAVTSEDDLTLEEDQETEELLQLDPKHWKEQDHYAVLGISKLRYKASYEQLKKAHRRRVLRHHPDKKASGGDANDDSFFKCIQKAWEVLSDPVRRAQYDSVDPTIEDTIPGNKEEGDFYEIYRPVFERESRFSKIQPVPLLGDTDSSRQDVEGFYDFWYKFDSWRTFEYLDKEDSETAENRDDKRFIEKKNKAERARRKKEDTARLRKLVDQALKLDPRITKFKEEERIAKESKRIAREQAAKQAEEEAKKKEEAEKQKQLQQAEEEKIRQQEEKREREAKKKANRRERKVIKNIIKDHNYLFPSSQTPPVDKIDIMLSELDTLFENLSLEELETLRGAMEKSQTPEDMSKVIQNQAKAVLEQGAISGTSFVHLVSDPETIKSISSSTPQDAHPAPKPRNSKERPWEVDEISLLIKAVNKFPGGTINRWETISDYISVHTGHPRRRNEEIIKKSKEVRQGTSAMDSTAVKKLQYQKKQKDSRLVEEPSQRYESDLPPIEAKDKPEVEPKPTTKSDPALWTPEEQAQLEGALQAYPPSWKGEGERWDKIAEAVVGRTKKECKQRVKYLIEKVRAKKQA
ncbi:DnaJ-domain-containing protein [Basidiobolus meristosporus CBS 931.73]|uniref:DnaJ-domain-containing protein n=1 Tax=Basidiobolus meristosporus CBS 931.73 TaxID=1314790 RepID=A0A1Y1YMN7_9FUNG|nr:DnaJ-domain-containing protein [Basidiobolus meristosporus CBS 931.73]|eukprot:ORX99113.1 DnaJ-domain-containing protein [Basidiobolus meristosporus CBS 931.73]